MAPDPAFRRISSRQNPVVARLRTLAREGDDEAVLIEGATLAGEAAGAGWSLELVALTEAALAVPSTARLVESFAEDTERLLVTSAVMEAMSPVRTPSGLVAVARARRVANGGLAPLDGPAPLLVCATDVQDPGNLGAIVRVAEAAGASSVLAAGASADPFGWKALRGSMGSAFRLPVVRRVPVDAAIDRARAAGCRLVAAVLEGTPLHDVDLSRPTCLFVGAEGAGLPATVLEAADVRLAIPMERPVESLNVAVAAAIILYEARRQRAAVRAVRP